MHSTPDAHVYGHMRELACLIAWHYSIAADFFAAFVSLLVPAKVKRPSADSVSSMAASIGNCPHNAHDIIGCADAIFWNYAGGKGVKRCEGVLLACLADASVV